jgi:hypothetical protein
MSFAQNLQMSFDLTIVNEEMGLGVFKFGMDRRIG